VLYATKRPCNQSDSQNYSHEKSDHHAECQAVVLTLSTEMKTKTHTNGFFLHQIALTKVIAAQIALFADKHTITDNGRKNRLNKFEPNSP
jgi:hypothetical protein